ncbi:MAG: hypothetical protein U0Q16_01355 [Bryobacteraceae bacterium]
MAGQFLSSIYTYPWDLHDEGLAAALKRIRDTTGVTELMVTPSYHVSTYFLPHNPKRPIYWGEDGAVYFRPEGVAFQNLRIKPRVSSLAAGAGYFERMAAAIRDHGFEFGAWIVYCFNHHLAEAYPEFAKHDAFGNAYLSQLSCAPQAVHDYALTLTSYVLDRFKPSAIHVESLSRMNWNYGIRNQKILSPISARCQFLLGVDFHGDFLQLWGKDGERFRRDVAEWLRVRMARLPTAEDNEPVTDQWIQGAFEGRLKAYLEACRKRTTELWTKAAQMIRQRGAKVQSGTVTASAQWRTGLALSTNQYLDRVTVGPGIDSMQVDRIRKETNPNAIVMVSTQPGSMTEAAPLAGQLKSAAMAGCRGSTFYNYGLLREEQLRFIGAALKSL